MAGNGRSAIDVLGGTLAASQPGTLDYAMAQAQIALEMARDAYAANPSRENGVALAQAQQFSVDLTLAMESSDGAKMGEPGAGTGVYGASSEVSAGNALSRGLNIDFGGSQDLGTSRVALDAGLADMGHGRGFNGMEGAQTRAESARALSGMSRLGGEDGEEGRITALEREFDRTMAAANAEQSSREAGAPAREQATRDAFAQGYANSTESARETSRGYGLSNPDPGAALTADLAGYGAQSGAFSGEAQGGRTAGFSRDLTGSYASGFGQEGESRTSDFSRGLTGGFSGGEDGRVSGNIGGMGHQGGMLSGGWGSSQASSNPNIGTELASLNIDAPNAFSSDLTGGFGNATSDLSNGGYGREAERGNAFSGIGDVTHGREADWGGGVERAREGQFGNAFDLDRDSRERQSEMSFGDFGIGLGYDTSW